MGARTITGRIIATARRRSSANGNPAYLLTIETIDGDTVQARTQADAMFSYGAENPEYRDTVHVFHMTPRTGQVAWAHTVAEHERCS